MQRVEYLTKTAEDLKYGVLCPVALNFATLESFFEMSNDLMQVPIAIRVNANKFDLGDYAHFANVFAAKYPQAVCTIMAAHVETYEQAVEACRYNYKGIALNDNITLDDSACRELIAKVGRVCKASDCSLQVTVKDPEILFDKEVQSFMLQAGVGIIRIIIKDEVNDSNIESYKALFKKIRDNVPACICVNDMSNIDTKYYEAFKWNGVSKFDVFAGASKDGAAAVVDLSNKNADKTNRALLPTIKAELFNNYITNLTKLAAACGNFVSRHAAAKPDALKK